MNRSTLSIVDAARQGDATDVAPPKTLDNYFCDWEAEVFGYGYGTGEPHIIPALRLFLSRCPDDGCYDYRVFEDALGPVVAWLLINILCKADILEYGTSPRAGWLTGKGQRLRAFVASRSDDELVHLTRRDTSEYFVCGPTACNCGPNGYEEGLVCQNPFWMDPR